MTATTLTIDEMSGIFKALQENDNSYSLQTALDDTIALAKAKGMAAADLAIVLEGAGMELTDNFQQWLEQKFSHKN